MTIKIWRWIWIVALAGVFMFLFEYFAMEKVEAPVKTGDQQKVLKRLEPQPSSQTSQKLEPKTLPDQGFKQSIYQNWSVPKQLNSEQSSVQDLLVDQDAPSGQAGGPLSPLAPKGKTDTKPQAFNPLLESEMGAGNRADQDSSFDYSYQGSEDDKHGVRLGVKSDGVTVRTDVKANSDGSEVQYIEIEVELPK